MRRTGRRGRVMLSAVLAFAATGLVTFAPAVPVAAAVADDDWQGIVNSYRAMSGLGPVTENPTWSAQGREHSCYMLLNGISHHQVPGNPGYTEGGHTAGMNGNVAVSSSATATARSHVDLWMTGPFHAIGVLRHNLTTSGFGICANANADRWRSGGTLDVLRGLASDRPRPATPIVFPGRDATVPLYRFIAETPNPVTLCGWSGPAGLPLIAMMPAGVDSAAATLTGPNGPIEVCTLHPGKAGGDATASAVMRSENAVVVVPRDHLQPGLHTATVTSSGGSVTWSFNVDPNAPLPVAAAPSSGPSQPASTPIASSTKPVTPTTAVIGKPSEFQPVTPYRHADSRRDLRVQRLRAGVITPVDITSSDATAVSANFTVAGQSGPGYLSVFNCTPVAPDVSTVNFGVSPAANQAVVPLDSGRLCMFSSADAHVIIDVNGLLRPGGSSATTTFHPISPTRLFDSRQPGMTRLTANTVRTIRVKGVRGGVPADATAVALNLTAVNPSDAGWMQTFPCDAGTGGISEVSNVNFAAGETRANSAVVPLSSTGDICVLADVDVDAIVDVSGHFTPSGGLQFTAVRGVRLLDTRSANTGVNPVTAATPVAAGQEVRLRIAGHYGVPAGAKAVAVNLTVVGPADAGFSSIYPCGKRPASSNLNFAAGDGAVANGTLVGLGSGGDICFVSDQAAHVLLDLSGVWS